MDTDIYGESNDVYSLRDKINELRYQLREARNNIEKEFREAYKDKEIKLTIDDKETNVFRVIKMKTSELLENYLKNLQIMMNNNTISVEFDEKTGIPKVYNKIIYT